MQRWMLCKLAAAAALVLALVSGDAALAQVNSANGTVLPPNSMSPTVTYQVRAPYFWYWPGYSSYWPGYTGHWSSWPGYTGHWGSWSSTTAEGYWRGRAEWLRARGEYNAATATALRAREEARSRAIENRAKATQAYFEQKRENRRYHAETAARRKVSVQATASNRIQPPRLTPAQLDPATGKIQWPAALQSESFANSRAALENQFLRWAAPGPCNPEVEEEIAVQADSLLAQLRAQIREINSMDWVQAKKFIEGLEQEARCESRSRRLVSARLD